MTSSTDVVQWKTCVFHVAIGVRHTDLDVQKNINNVAFADIFEEARTQYSVSRKLKPQMDPHRRVIDTLTIRFIEDARYPGAFDVHVGVASLAADSWILRCVAVQNDRVIAVNDCTFRLVGEDRQAITLPAGLIAILEKDLIVE